jgi:hypothetical protein
MPLNNLSDFSIPDTNSADNINWGDVIGTKLDTYLGNSIYSLLSKAATIVSSPREVYPTLAAGATVASANTDWVYGNYATIIPAGTIDVGYHVLAINVSSCDHDAVLQLELCQGPTDIPITTMRFAVVNGFFGNVYTIGSAQVPADAQVRARLASGNGTAQVTTITMSLVYWRFT